MSRLITALVALICGGMFGTGLAVSGMTDTRVVLGFLDIAGDWNPDLAFVMGGALAITIPGFYLLGRRSRPVFAAQFHLPVNNRIDGKLIVGAVIFGAGWGLYGYCPGPALASLLTWAWQPVLFVAAMATGMLIENLLRRN